MEGLSALIVYHSSMSMKGLRNSTVGNTVLRGVSSYLVEKDSEL